MDIQWEFSVYIYNMYLYIYIYYNIKACLKTGEGGPTCSVYIFAHNHIIGCECWGYYLYKLFWGIPVRYHLTVHNIYGS